MSRGATISLFIFEPKKEDSKNPELQEMETPGTFLVIKQR
jgi:hypothetical protein